VLKFGHSERGLSHESRLTTESLLGRSPHDEGPSVPARLAARDDSFGTGVADERGPRGAARRGERTPTRVVRSFVRRSFVRSVGRSVAGRSVGGDGRLREIAGTVSSDEVRESVDDDDDARARRGRDGAVPNANRFIARDSSRGRRSVDATRRRWGSIE